MGDSDLSDAQKPVSVTAAVEGDGGPSKDKKKARKSETSNGSASHVSGRLLQIAVGPAGVEFTIKGKKGKNDAFDLSTLPSAVMPTAAAILSMAHIEGAKVRLEFIDNGQGQRKLSRVMLQG